MEAVGSVGHRPPDGTPGIADHDIDPAIPADQIHGQGRRLLRRGKISWVYERFPARGDNLRPDFLEPAHGPGHQQYGGPGTCQPASRRGADTFRRSGDENDPPIHSRPKPLLVRSPTGNARCDPYPMLDPAHRAIV
nr:hypothetical protein [Actinoplanes utahensis]